MALALRILTMLLALAFCARAEDGRGAASLRQPGEGRAFSASRALVIGVNGYDNGWRKLAQAIPDAEAVAEALKAAGFDEVETLKDPDSATLAGAIKRFVYVKGADPDARLLIWFAGHGHTIGAEGYLVPRDAPLPDGTPAGEAAFQASAVAMADFSRYMNEVKARHVLAVFDSCFSGSVFDNNRVSVPASAIVNRNQLARQFIASGRAGEVAADDGAFRRAFVDALSGTAGKALGDDGYLTGSRLGAFLAATISAASGGHQNPLYATTNVVGLDRGDFLFPLRFDPETGRRAAGATSPPAAPAGPAPIELYIDTIQAAPGDPRAADLAGRLERGLVEYYVTNKIYVSSRLTGREAARRPNRVVRGDVRLFGEDAQIEAVLSDADGHVIATSSLSAPAEFLLANHRVVAPAVHYLFDVSLRSFERLQSANRSTADGHAWALYLAARRRAEIGDFPGAASFLRDAVVADPRFASAYGALADLAERSGEPAEAVAALRTQAAAIDRDHNHLQHFRRSQHGRSRAGARIRAGDGDMDFHCRWRRDAPLRRR
ncbi:MAG: caspase family protein [Phyllobacteriaceae bacterium]|nr:caspase family protein [Phyllobacteriaceae bacterium]